MEQEIATLAKRFKWSFDNRMRTASIQSRFKADTEDVVRRFHTAISNLLETPNGREFLGYYYPFAPNSPFLENPHVRREGRALMLSWKENDALQEGALRNMITRLHTYGVRSDESRQPKGSRREPQQPPRPHP